jgi:CheY-like chemotaxis protein
MTNRKILLVEDRAADVRLVKRAILKAGYTVDFEVAENGQEALDILLDTTRKVPDLILLDWMMPLIDGAEVLQRMRAEPHLKRVPVIILTTSHHEADINGAYTHGCNAYLTKPINPDHFQQTIEALGLFWLQAARLPT